MIAEPPTKKAIAATGEPTALDFRLPGETIGDFRLLRKLGVGGMGEVYLAEQISLKRKVAIKMVREDVLANPTVLARFQSECETIAKLSHANVVQAYMLGEHDGRHFLVLEYVDGVSLHEYIRRKGPLEVPLVLSILRQVASALVRASELGIVHRDIKPENILLTRKGEAKVADFGLARCLAAEERVNLTRVGASVGTPLYMSPEQIRGGDIDCRTDIYSLGVTCYYMLAGKPPFKGSNAYVLAAQHMNDDPPALEKARPELPAALCELVARMMAKKPDQRLASARELLQAISKVRRSLGATDTPIALAVETSHEIDEGKPTASTPLWRRPLVWLAGVAALAIAAVVGVVALVLLGVAFTWSHRPQVEEPAPIVRAETPNDDKTAVPAPTAEPTPPAVDAPSKENARHDNAFPKGFRRPPVMKMPTKK